MKRSLILLLVLLSMYASGCGYNSKNKNYDFFVGMITDSGRVDDRSFNQGTWEGMKSAAADLSGIRVKYLIPKGATQADKNKEIINLHDAQADMIILPGFKFENSVYKMQQKYPETKFVIMDSVPRSETEPNKVEIAQNTVAIIFAEHEAGFLAGVATALQLQTGSVGFIGGMEIPPVQRYGWGFEQGIAYANAYLGTTVAMEQHNIVYQGTFTDVAAGQQLAAQMYNNGVKAIFIAAGSVGNGVINEAVARAKSGNYVWVISCDVDQYEQGIYDRQSGKSIILTAALKDIGQASYSMIVDLKQNEFRGGRLLVFGVKNNGVGISMKNPNLGAEVKAHVNRLKEKIAKDELVVTEKRP